MKDKINKYVSDWENKCYQSGLPDEVPLRLEQLNKVPSYKAIVRAILKNDESLKSLGLTQRKCTHYHTLKRIEIEQRTPPVQLKILFNSIY